MVGGSILTATSCEYNYDDPAVVVLKSTSPDATPTSLSCLGANDNSEYTAADLLVRGGHEPDLGRCRPGNYGRSAAAKVRQHACYDYVAGNVWYHLHNIALMCPHLLAGLAPCQGNTETSTAFTATVVLRPNTYCECSRGR